MGFSFHVNKCATIIAARVVEKGKSKHTQIGTKDWQCTKAGRVVRPILDIAHMSADAPKHKTRLCNSGLTAQNIGFKT